MNIGPRRRQGETEKVLALLLGKFLMTLFGSVVARVSRVRRMVGSYWGGQSLFWPQGASGKQS